MKILFVFSLALTLFITSCNEASDASPDKKNSAIELKSVDIEIVNQNNDFSLQLFNEILLNDPVDKNVFISPLSVYFALAMAHNGADGETLAEFKTLLGWEAFSEADVLNSLQKLHEYLLSGSNCVELDLANSIWPRIDFEPKAEFITVNQDYLDAEVKPLDFSQPEAVNIINTWIEDNTNGKIKDALDEIPADAIMYLINAIYFNASWKYEFDVEDNTTQPFYPASGSSKDLTYMNQECMLQLANVEGYRAAKLPYADSNYYMVVLLPNNNKTPEEVIAGLDAGAWEQMQKSFTYSNTKLMLPKFKFIYGTRLINAELMAMGLVQAFTGNANFKRIADRNILISRVLHKAFVDVSEKGTEAAAVTIIEMLETSAINEPEISYFTVNRSFVFAICEEQTDAILFMGRVNEPEYTE